jgi:hypothetical protein
MDAVGRYSLGMSSGQIFFAVISILAAVIMGLARTPPIDAISNLSKWLEWAGVRRLPHRFRNPNADRWATLIAIVVLLVGIGGFGYTSFFAFPSTNSKPEATRRLLDEKLPGFGAGMVVRINDLTENKKNYQYNFHTPEDARTAFYLAPSNHFVFTVTDVHGENYSLEIPLGNQGVPFETFVFIFCEVGTASNYSYLRALVNGREVARRDYNFPLDLGTRRWMPNIGGGVFMMSEISVYSVTLDDKELGDVSNNVLQYYKLDHDK